MQAQAGVWRDFESTAATPYRTKRNKRSLACSLLTGIRLRFFATFPSARPDATFYFSCQLIIIVVFFRLALFCFVKFWKVWGVPRTSQRLTRGA
jgi:hypothetical protein